MKMCEVIKNEIKKSRQSLKRIIPVTLAFLGFYLFIAYSGTFTGYTGQNYEFLFQNRDQIVVLKKQKSGVVDRQFIQEAEDTYREYVDKFRSSDEEIAGNLEKCGEPYTTVEDVLYDPQYIYFVFNKKALEEHPEIELLEEETRPVIEYARDPEKYMLESEAVSAYSKVLQEDYRQCIRQYQSGKKIVAGYFLGWDMAISLMQYLPVALGIVIVVSLFGVFARERRYQMPSLLLTTKYGWRKLLAAKLIIAWALTTVQWLLFQLAGLAVSAGLLSLSGKDCTFFSPLHPSVYGFSCIQFYLMQLLVSYLGTMFFMLAVCLISCLLYDRLALICGLVATYATSFCNTSFWDEKPAYSTMEKIVALIPTQLIGGYNTFPYYQAYSFGNLVLRLPVMTGIVLGIGIVVCLCAVILRWHRMS